MTKKEQLIEQLRPLLDDRQALETFLLTHSNLPGPRANLELLWAVAEVYDNRDVLDNWRKIPAEEADANDPRNYLVCAAAVCYGKMAARSGDADLIAILKEMAKDSRWRVRESVAFAFQFIGEVHFDVLRSTFTDWMPAADTLEQRAILVSLAHPPFLNEERAAFCLEMTEIVLASLSPGSPDFEVLRKSLEFVISVFAAANPSKGFALMEKWIGADKVRDRILKANLKKNRIARPFPEETARLLEELG